MATKVQKLGGGDRFQPADFSISRYAAKVPSGTTLKDFLHPEYLANHLDRLKPGMEIAVLSDDFELDARLRVLTVSKSTAKLRVMAVYAGDHDEQDGSQTISFDDVKVSFGGPNHKWRYSHGEKVIEFGYASKEEAESAAVRYVEKING